MEFIFTKNPEDVNMTEYYLWYVINRNGKGIEDLLRRIHEYN